jgi:Flp pilus assembly protein TadG
MTRTRGERGAAVIEFALVLPILVLLVLGIMEFGRAYHVQTTISGAAREGARVMALQSDSAAAQAAAQSAAQPLAVSVGQINVSPSSCTTSDDVVTVTVSYPLTFLTGAFGAAVTLTGKGVMRCNG